MKKQKEMDKQEKVFEKVKIRVESGEMEKMQTEIGQHLDSDMGQIGQADDKKANRRKLLKRTTA